MGIFDSITKFFSSDEFASLPERDREYRKMLAELIFGIDGQLADSERQELDAMSAAHPGARQALLPDESLAPNVTFALVKSRHQALDWPEGERKKLIEWVRKKARADREITPEENALLIQLGQIFASGERVELFLASKEDARTNHGFFQRFTKEQLETNFPQSRCDFSLGDVYTHHPFLADALVHFSESGLQQAQRDSLLATVALLRELGVKRVRMKFSKNLNAAIGVSQGVSLTRADATLKQTLTANANVLKSNAEEIECEYKGSIPLYARFLPGYWKRALIRKSSSWHDHVHLIESRLSRNQETKRRHVVHSELSAKFAYALSNTIHIKGVDVGTDISANAEASLAISQELEFEY